MYVDRWNRKTTMISTNVLMTVAVLPLPLVRQPTGVWLIYAATASVGVLKLFTVPAEQAMLPRLVPDEELVNANALNGQTREVARLLGSAAGGLVIATGGITALALGDAVTFVAAAALVAGIRTDGSVVPDPGASHESGHESSHESSHESGHESGHESRAGIRSLAREWTQGLRLAASRRELQAVGGILGGLVAVNLGRRLSPAAMFGFGAVAFGLVDLVMFLYPLIWVLVWPAAVCMVVVGVPGAVAMVGYKTLLQRGTNTAFRGRVIGALGAVQGTAVVIGTLTAGFLGDVVGILPIIALQGDFGVLGGFVVLSLLRRQLAR